MKARQLPLLFRVLNLRRGKNRLLVPPLVVVQPHSRWDEWIGRVQKPRRGEGKGSMDQTLHERKSCMDQTLQRTSGVQSRA